MKTPHKPSPVIVITGSSQGIGKTTAASFLRQGARVVINGRNPAKLQAARQALQELGEVIAVPGDVSNWEEMAALVKAVLQQYGRIDVLICNAGIKFEDRFDQTRIEVMDKIMQVNTLGVVYPIKAALDALVESGGSIVMISSLAGLYGLPGGAIYSASKMALTALQQGLSLELAPRGVHVGILYVGFTENDQDSGIINGAGELNAFPDRGLKRQPQARVAAAIQQIAARKRTYQ
ncbi:MAG: SDR family oxidoreductase, partial [Bacteroidota bacterium]